MKKDQIILLQDRGLISISGEDAKDFLQNIITNDINKVNVTNTIFSGLFTPQGKYLFEFFLIQSKNGYLLDCNNKFTQELINYLSKYILRSKVKVKDLSSDYVVGVLSLEKFNEIKKKESKNTSTIEYRESFLFIDPRKKELGSRILSTIDKLHLTIKKLNLKITEPEIYYSKAHSLGVPTIGIEKLKDKLFGLEANFEELNAIDFKKGCYIGQENTARMKLKNKLRKRLVAVKTDANLQIGSELNFNGEIVGKVLIDKPFPFLLVNLYYNNIDDLFKNEFLIEGKKVKLINYKTK